MGKLDGKVAIISGAARGQGEARRASSSPRARGSCSATCSTTEGEAVAASLGDVRPSTCTST